MAIFLLNKTIKLIFYLKLFYLSLILFIIISTLSINLKNRGVMNDPYVMNPDLQNLNWDHLYQYQNGGQVPNYAPKAPPVDNPNIQYPAIHGLQNDYLQPVVHVVPKVQVPPKPLLTAKIHQETSKLLTKAWEMSTIIIDGDIQRPSPYAPQVVQPDPVAKKQEQNINVVYVERGGWNPPGWFWWMNLLGRNEVHHHHHYHHHNEEQNNQKNNDAILRLFLGAISLAGLLFLGYKAGQAAAEGEKIEKKVSSFDDMKKDWAAHKNCYSEEYQSTVDKIVKYMDSILNRDATNRTHRIALIVFGVIASGTALTGAVIASEALMAGGVIVGAGTGLGALFKLGYSHFSTASQDDAQAIREKLSELDQLGIAIQG